MLFSPQCTEIILILTEQGKFGFEGGARSSVGAKFIDVFAGLSTLDISCGYGHVLYVVHATTPDGVAKLASYPELPAPKFIAPLTSSVTAKGKESSKKRAAEVKEEPKKKGKGK